MINSFKQALLSACCVADTTIGVTKETEWCTGSFQPQVTEIWQE